jgi:hypothetical protein
MSETIGCLRRQKVCFSRIRFRSQATRNDGFFTYPQFVTAHQRGSKLLIANCLMWLGPAVSDLHAGHLCAS